jgi:hypothetical protein
VPVRLGARTIGPDVGLDGAAAEGPDAGAGRGSAEICAAIRTGGSAALPTGAGGSSAQAVKNIGKAATITPQRRLRHDGATRPEAPLSRMSPASLSRIWSPPSILPRDYILPAQQQTGRELGCPGRNESASLRRQGRLSLRHRCRN